MFFIKKLLKKSDNRAINKKVAVFFGGKSTEHDISIITGVLTLNAIDKQKYDAVAVFVDNDGKWYGGDVLNKLPFYKKIDYKKLKRLFLLCGDDVLYTLSGTKAMPYVRLFAAINCMHGINGEDGTLFGALSLSGIPFVSPGVFASSLSIDKDYTKLLIKSLEIPVVESVRVLREEFYKNRKECLADCSKKLGFPQIVKPARLGSSIGIKTVQNENELEGALSAAFSFDGKAVCEKYIKKALDVNVAAYASKGTTIISFPEKAITSNDILTFDDKYGGAKGGLANSRREPFDKNCDYAQTMREYAKKIYERLDFCGIVRFDFLLSESNVFLNEINAVPGSLAYYFFCDKMGDFSSLLNELIEEAVKIRRKEDNYLTSFNTSVLDVDYKGSKK